MFMFGNFLLYSKLVILTTQPLVLKCESVANVKIKWLKFDICKLACKNSISTNISSSFTNKT